MSTPSSSSSRSVSSAVPDHVNKPASRAPSPTNIDQAQHLPEDQVKFKQAEEKKMIQSSQLPTPAVVLDALPVAVSSHGAARDRRAHSAGSGGDLAVSHDNHGTAAPTPAVTSSTAVSSSSSSTAATPATPATGAGTASVAAASEREHSPLLVKQHSNAHHFLGQELPIDRSPANSVPATFLSDDEKDRAQMMLLSEDEEDAGFTFVPSRRASMKDTPEKLSEMLGSLTLPAIRESNESETHNEQAKAKDGQTTTTAAADASKVDKEDKEKKDNGEGVEDEEDTADETTSILKHVDSFTDLHITLAAPPSTAQDTIPSTSQHVSDKETHAKEVSFATSTKQGEPDGDGEDMDFRSASVVAMVVGATDPNSLTSPPNYELKIHIIRGGIHGGGLKNVSHVEVRINDQLIHTTANVSAPPIWNETVHYYLHSLDFSAPVIISISLYKKRWTAAGFKLVGTTSLSLSELTDTILDKHGIVEKEYNLNINRWNITLTGNLYLGFQLRSINADNTASSAAKNSRSVTPSRESLGARRASFKHTGTTFAFKTRGIDDALEGRDTALSTDNDPSKIASEEDTLTDENGSTLQKLQQIVVFVQTWINVETLQQALQILLDIAQIFVEMLKSVDSRVYVVFTALFVMYLIYLQHKTYRSVSLAVREMDVLVDRMLLELLKSQAHVR